MNAFNNYIAPSIAAVFAMFNLVMTLVAVRTSREFKAKHGATVTQCYGANFAVLGFGFLTLTCVAIVLILLFVGRH